MNLRVTTIIEADGEEITRFVSATFETMSFAQIPEALSKATQSAVGHLVAQGVHAILRDAETKAAAGD